MPRSAVLFSNVMRCGGISKPPQKKSRLPKKSRKGHVLVGRTTCPKCNKTLAFSSVKPHMIRFHPSSPKVKFVCTHHGCTEEFDSRTGLYRHRVAAHHYQPRTRVYHVYRNPRYSPPTFTLPRNRYCPACRTTFSSRPDFLRHKKECQNADGEALEADRVPVDRPPTIRPLPYQLPQPDRVDESEEGLQPESPVIGSVRSRKGTASRQPEKSDTAFDRFGGYGTLQYFMVL